MAYVQMSRALLDSGGPVGSFVRVDPENPADSGWRFYAGGDDPEASEMVVVGADTLIGVDPLLAEFLSGPVGAVFDRDGDRGYRARTGDEAPDVADGIADAHVLRWTLFGMGVRCRGCGWTRRAPSSMGRHDAAARERWLQTMNRRHAASVALSWTAAAAQTDGRQGEQP